MQLVWNEILNELALEWPSSQQLVRVSVRLILAVLLTAIIGWNRERGHKTAGLRTHLLVSLGSALFVISAIESLPDKGDVTRIIQGIATGIGFIGGGAILKLESQNRIRGLTTAGSIWLSAAIGVAAGLGKLGVAVVGILLAWFILSSLEKIMKKLEPQAPEKHTS